MLVLHQRVIKTKVPITYTSNDPGLPWDFSKILKSLNNENYFSGGRVKVKTNFGDECVFHIRGKNPTKTIADDYIKNEVGNPVIEWMPIGIARHETGLCKYAHFNKRGVFNAGDSDIKFTPNEAGDGGLGLFQLTNSPTPENAHFWSWKKNSNAGINKLKRSYKEANEWMNAPVGFIGIRGILPFGGQRVQARAENNGVDQPVPNQTEGGIVFADDTNRPIEHAVALKIYNGASRGDYCVWINRRGSVKGYWKFNVLNNLNSNYVQKVCSAYVAGGGQ